MAPGSGILGPFQIGGSDLLREGVGELDGPDGGSQIPTGLGIVAREPHEWRLGDSEIGSGGVVVSPASASGAAAGFEVESGSIHVAICVGNAAGSAGDSGITVLVGVIINQGDIAFRVGLRDGIVAGSAGALASAKEAVLLALFGAGDVAIEVEKGMNLEPDGVSAGDVGYAGVKGTPQRAGVVFDLSGNAHVVGVNAIRASGLVGKGWKIIVVGSADIDPGECRT